MISAKQPTDSRVDWLPAERLGQASIDARVRAWMIGNGLPDLVCLRVRRKRGSRQPDRPMTDCCSPGLRQQILRTPDNAALFRDVEMECDGRVWVFAQSVVPDSTLTAYPWLAEQATLRAAWRDLERPVGP